MALANKQRVVCAEASNYEYGLYMACELIETLLIYHADINGCIMQWAYSALHCVSSFHCNFDVQYEQLQHTQFLLSEDFILKLYVTLCKQLLYAENKYYITLHTCMSTALNRVTACRQQVGDGSYSF